MIRKFVGFMLIMLLSVPLFPFAFTESISNAEEGQLDQRLAQIRSKNKGRGTDLAKLEKECLDLLREYEAPEDKGRIYATIVRIYTDKGYPPDEYIDIYCSKTAEYGEKVLQYPLEITTTCDIYFRWGEALEIKYEDAKEKEDFAVVRRKIAILWLTGLKLVLDNLTVTEKQDLPAVGKFHFSGPLDDPRNQKIYQKMLKKYEEEMATRREAEFQNKLLNLRWLFISKCTYLYSHKPDSRDELKNLAEGIVKDPKVVKQLSSIVWIDDVVVSPCVIPADGISTSQASASVTPPSRKLRWSIRGNALGCKIDPDTGVITAGTKAGNITIRATDTKVPDAWAEGTLTLEPKK